MLDKLMKKIPDPSKIKEHYDLFLKNNNKKYLNYQKLLKNLKFLT